MSKFREGQMVELLTIKMPTDLVDDMLRVIPDEDLCTKGRIVYKAIKEPL